MGCCSSSNSHDTTTRGGTSKENNGAGHESGTQPDGLNNGRPLNTEAGGGSNRGTSSPTGDRVGRSKGSKKDSKSSGAIPPAPSSNSVGLPFGTAHADREAITNEQWSDAQAGASKYHAGSSPVQPDTLTYSPNTANPVPRDRSNVTRPAPTHDESEAHTETFGDPGTTPDPVGFKGQARQEGPGKTEAENSRPLKKETAREITTNLAGVGDDWLEMDEVIVPGKQERPTQKERSLNESPKRGQKMQKTEPERKETRKKGEAAKREIAVELPEGNFDDEGAGSSGMTRTFSGGSKYHGGLSASGSSGKRFHNTSPNIMNSELPAAHPATSSQSVEAPDRPLAIASSISRNDGIIHNGGSQHPSPVTAGALQKQNSLQAVQKHILDSAATGSTRLESICGLIRVPSLLPVIRGLSRIVKTAQAIPKGDCQELLEHTSTLMIAVIAPLIGEPAERTEPQMLERIDRLAKVLTAVLGDLQVLKKEMSSKRKTTPAVDKAQQGRINGCLAEITRASQAFQIKLLVPTDVDRLRQYLDQTNVVKTTAETSALSNSFEEMHFLEERLKPVPARYNLCARVGVSGCLEGTRIAILKTLRDWISSPDQVRLQIFWLKGQAGTGKSSIAHTISEECDAKGNLGASFFFSRDQADRTDGLRVLTSIAYQLACSIPGFRAGLLMALKDDREARTLDISTQLQELILAPLQRVSGDAPSPIVIVLDALNECENPSITADIVACIAGIAPQLPDWLRLRILITSRPKLDNDDSLHTTAPADSANSQSMEQAGDNSGIKIETAIAAFPVESKITSLDDIEPEIVAEDIGHYLRRCLQDESHIVTDGDVGRLVGIADGRFIIASTAVRFITESKVEDRKHRLDDLLLAMADYKNRTPGATKPSAVGIHPPSPLDFLYFKIIQKALSRWTEESNLKHHGPAVLGAVAHLYNPLSPQSLETLLQLPRSTVSNALLPLHSVVSVPNPYEVAPVRLIHQSFPDFLIASSRYTDTIFFIDPPLQHSQIALHCLQHMSESLSRDICGIGFLPTLNSDVKDLHKRLQVKVPLHLRYACLYWPLHLAQARLSGYAESDVRRKVVHQLVDAFGKFVRTKLLCWLEIMSLLGRLDVVAVLLRGAEYGLESLLEVPRYKLQQSTSAPSEVLEIVKDVRRFVKRFFKPISQSAGAIYSSALVFTPQCRLYHQYQFEITQPNPSVLVRLGQGKGWDQSATPTHGSVTSVAFSPNGVYIAAAFSDGTVQLWAHFGLSLATLVDSSSTDQPRTPLPDSDQPSTSFDGRVAEAYGTQKSLDFTRPNRDNDMRPNVSFDLNGQQVILRSSTGQCIWTRDISRYTVAILPKEMDEARGHLQWGYPWVTYLDWRLCYLEASDWTWALRGDKMALGTPSGDVLILDFSAVIRVVDKYRHQHVTPNNPLPFLDA